jgi:hypothetical protein
VSVAAVAARVALAFKVELGQFQEVDLVSLSGELKSLVVVLDGNALDKILRSAEMAEQVTPPTRITGQLEVIHLQVSMELDPVAVQAHLVALVS